ncbi:aminopeptidase [Mucor velutinosus]|uniref:General negative regulator of transcription subunit 1 n=1 Tax=Mucor velutinosus TaxID=708070 RepID=A0AAN7DI02_9FUNG|nr:aminopeptidase [Mucor velutinosus]
MSSESELSNASTPSPKQQRATTTKLQKASLARIVKAQVTLLISNLNNDNFTRKSTEIHSLIETHGEDIREHLFRYLLSDIYKLNLIKDESSPHFRLLKENAVFSTQDNKKLEAMISFSLALQQFSKSDVASKADICHLFDRLELDPFDKIVFTLPLFSGVKGEISEQAKSVFGANLQNAIAYMSTIESIPDKVLQYLLDAIAHALSEDSYQFDYEKLQRLITLASERFMLDTSVVDQLQRLLSIKTKQHGGHLSKDDDQQFKQSIIEMYNNNPASVTRILDLTKEIHALPQILDSLPPYLALDLASLADHQKAMHLESWLQEKLKNPEQKEVFANQCLLYLNQKVSIEAQRQEGSQQYLPIPLSLEAMSTFLRVLSDSPISPALINTTKEVQNRCLQTFPKLMNVRTQAAPGSTGSEVSFKPDVEEEANLYYERIYNGELSTDVMIDLLKKLSASKEPREQDVFACMVHNLFDEYSFFPKYPDKELSITSILFGSLIQHRLVSYVPLGVALRYVLDALRNPMGSKMFNFGVQALRQFQNRLSEWPQYCSHLLQIPDLVQSQPDLAAFIQNAMNHQEVQVKPGEDLDPNANNSNRATLEPFTSIQVPQVPATADVVYSEPADAVQDKILFIINNVAQNNIDSKVADLLQVLKPPTFKWFSNYLVVKRISSEPNYHDLYILVLDSVKSKLLNEHVLCETYANISILLNSEKTVSNSSERSLLKNLGSWLGRMTLAKNKPILHKHIAFKAMIPFVCKVLEQCSQSSVFKPPNPWLVAILRLMVELYDFAELKLNLKFEIEVLCKTLSLDLKDIKPTSVLKNRQPQNQPSRNTFAAHGAGYPGRAAAGGNPLLQNADVDGQADIAEAPIPVPNLAPYIAFNPQIPLYTNQPAARRLVLQAFTESIREIIGPVVERAVAIAVVSTRDLVSKDFVMEADENKMRKAAHMMAQNLAASLAMVTSKEPLRLSIVNNLRTIFLAHGMNESMAEQAIILTVADNLDLMCAVIEKAAMEKATLEIDEVLAMALLNRKKHHEVRPNQPYIDMDTYQMSGFANTLPALLRPKPSGLQPSQLSVYEDFMRIPRAAPSAASTTPMMDRAMARVDPGFHYGSNSPLATSTAFDNSLVGNQQQQLPQASAHVILERFAHCITELEKLTSQTNINTVNALPQHSDIRTLIRQVPMLAFSSFDKAEAARTFAQKIVQLLYKSEKQLTIEAYVVILEHLCELSPTVGSLVTSWLTHADDERKYNVPVTVALIKAGLIDLPEQDQELSILIESGRTSAIEFTARLIRACLFGEHPLATRHEFMASLEALSNLRGNKLPESVLALMEDMRTILSSHHQQQQQQHLMRDNQTQDNSKDAALREQFQFFFAEWVRLYQHPATTEKTMLAFATQLSQQSILKIDGMLALFYRVCIEVSVEHAIKSKMMPGQSPALGYHPIDALSKLVMCFVRMPPTSPENDQADALAYFTNALSVVVLCISQHHEVRGQHFDQRPFLRLFTCLLSDLHSAEQHIQPLYIPLLTAFSNTLYTLQPTHYTGFTFAWLQLVSHRFFMPQLLLAENQKGWPTFQRLLVCLFQFLVPYLRNVELHDTTRMLYRGTLRVLLVLLHDFPEFLCDYHYSFCDVIPATCIQMRNLILSAFPRNMRLPDPFTPNLKIDLLPEIHQSPRILSDFAAIIDNCGLKKDLDQYFNTSRAPSSRFLNDLPGRLLNESKDYNVPLMNAVVFYLGISTISKKTTFHQGPAMEIYQYLLSELGSEGKGNTTFGMQWINISFKLQGRYLFLSAIANQLRYPNSHTHYFSCVLLYLFVESKKDIAKEQITRVLLERLIVNRPHPWGLLITFIELIKNPHYSFWSHSFTRCATDIERLFESVSRSINQN